MGDKRPHVLLVVDQFPKTLGGGERIVLRLAALLPRYGYRVSILTFFIHPECGDLRSAACPIYLLPLQRTYDLNALRASLVLRKFLREQDVQIVQTFFESSDIWAGFVTKVLSSAMLIWSRRDMGIIRSRKHVIAYRWMASVPDAVFAVSEQVRRYCIDVDRVDAGRVETIYNGVDVDGWCTLRHAAKSDVMFVVTTVGNIRRVKGHDVFIRAAALVRSQWPNTSFRIAGEVLEPQYFAELEVLVKDLGLTEHVQFLGGVSDVREQLRTVDLFVLPSRSEGFSNAIVEAMAAALPVVATDVGGNAEAVQNGISGFVVPPDDAEALAAAITKFLTDRSLAERMGEAGRRIAFDKFTTEAMMTRITSKYCELLARPAKRH